MAALYNMAVVAAPIRYTSVAICPYVISIGYICCPSMPQSTLCMALHLVATSVHYAANGSVLEGLVGMHAALLASMNGTHIMEDSMVHLSHNLYRISDKVAGQLVRDTPAKRLPRYGYEMRVQLPDGRMAWLKRMRLTMLDNYKNKRGWVWCVSPDLPMGKP